MNTTKIISVSMPQGLVTSSKRLAKKNHMTQSELVRTALREYIESQQAGQVISIAKEELVAGKVKKLKGSLVSMM